MKVYRSLSEVPPDFGPSALTIGNFDGVHYGHRQILRRVKAIAQERGLSAGVLTFDPHPTRVVAPERTPPLLTSPAERAARMGEEGIDNVLILPFTQEVAQLSPREFVESLLVNSLGARAVLVGDNFRFGHRQAGNVAVLRSLGEELGFETCIVSAVSCRGYVVSSSGIRGLLNSGRVSMAGRLLMRPYSVEGQVVSGRGVGSRQTVPTLNLATTAEVIPARGVYITRTVELEGTRATRAWDSITNIGNRPTFGTGRDLSIETFLLTTLEGGPPRQIRVEFLRRVRDERRFAGPEALRAQILKDAGTAETYFRRVRARVARTCSSC